MLFMIIVVRDCFEPNYIKLVGGINVASIFLDIVWIVYYKVKSMKLTLRIGGMEQISRCPLGGRQGTRAENVDCVLHIQSHLEGNLFY